MHIQTVVVRGTKISLSVYRIWLAL